jgi:hypothetical protein
MFAQGMIAFLHSITDFVEGITPKWRNQKYAHLIKKWLGMRIQITS